MSEYSRTSARLIDVLDLDVIVMKGVRPTDLRRGPGWIDWGNLPGPNGTCGISGHRTACGAPFGRIGELAEGDTIDLYSSYRRYRSEWLARSSCGRIRSRWWHPLRHRRFRSPRATRRTVRDFASRCGRT